MEKTVVISEFNPFHNGHRHLFDEVRKTVPGTELVCVMSQNFTQRGEAAVMDSYTRARHAVESGADAVIALPAAFSVAPAEIFAKGAVKIAAALRDVKYVAFGCETDSLETLVKAAEITTESERFRGYLKNYLSDGLGYAVAYENAYIDCGGEENVLNRPNNTLAVEYIGAAKSINFNPEYIAVKRYGAEHGSSSPSEDICSSDYIRQNLKSPSVAGYVPACVLADMKKSAGDYSEGLKRAETLCVLRDGPAGLPRVYGCTEGLENVIYGACTQGLDPTEFCGKRYSRSRISRILCANLLKITRGEVESYLDNDLYIRPLAVDEKRKDEIYSDLSASRFPLYVRGRDIKKLSAEALGCLKKDSLAELMYEHLGGKIHGNLTLLDL
ncbi:MAG: nucleotidyltransferase family protein [Clostridia bacterium]|nr:nucleotidyltransferase family protein [Clostridia bacterium]